MVTLKHEITIPTPAKNFWSALQDPKYVEHPARTYLGKMTRAVGADGVSTETYVLPPPSDLLAKIPGADKRADYTQTERRDDAKGLIAWQVQVHNSLIRDKAKITGTTRITEAGPGACLRTIEAEVNIPAPLGWLVAPIIAADMKRGFARDGEFAQKFDWKGYASPAQKRGE